jgi:hypothetical protein
VAFVSIAVVVANLVCISCTWSSEWTVDSRTGAEVRKVSLARICVPTRSICPLGRPSMTAYDLSLISMIPLTIPPYDQHSNLMITSTAKTLRLIYTLILITIRLSVQGNDSIMGPIIVPAISLLPFQSSLGDAPRSMDRLTSS